MNSGNIPQYVCLVCGYNMTGYYPDFCPFCGATKDRFSPAEENSSNHHVECIRINESLTRLNSVPKRGYEHAAYRVVADGTIFSHLTAQPRKETRSFLPTTIFSEQVTSTASCIRPGPPSMKQIPGTNSAGVSRSMISSWAVFVTAGSRHYISVATHRALPAFF